MASAVPVQGVLKRFWSLQKKKKANTEASGVVNGDDSLTQMSQADKQEAERRYERAASMSFTTDWNSYPLSTSPSCSSWTATALKTVRGL